MAQLFRQSEKDYNLWSNGFASFQSHFENGLPRLPVAVICRIGNSDEDDLALLDTGAEWSVINSDIAKTLRDQLGEPIGPLTMGTRHGDMYGELYRINITLLAEPGCGNDLLVEGTVFFSQHWPGPTVLGYRGFLEKIRIALDPGATDGTQTFFFGSDR